MRDCYLMPHTRRIPGNPSEHAMIFVNCYADRARAEAYDTLEFAGTYYLAYRDLPVILTEHVAGNRALDFGCGTGRSTRFLQRCGFAVVGVDIATDMLERARNNDPAGVYRLIGNGDLSQFADHSFDLILSAFTFDNIATAELKLTLFREFRRLLAPSGRLVNLVSAPEIYWHEWASFSTRDFPENRQAKAGDVVRIVVTDHADRRPVEDILWPHQAYVDLYGKAGFELVSEYRPLAAGNEPYHWGEETRIAPWVIYVLKPAILRP